MSMNAGPFFERRSVKSLVDLVLITPQNFSSMTDDKPAGMLSEDFASVRDEGSLYVLDPDSLVAPDVSIGFPFGKNVVFSRTALTVDPALLPSGSTIADIIGSANNPGRWFRFGSVSIFRTTNLSFTAAGSPVNVFATDVILGAQKTSTSFKVSFSCGLRNNDAANSAFVLFEILLDGVVQTFRKARTTVRLGVTTADTVSLEAVIDNVPEGLHQVQIRASTTNALGVTIDAGNGAGDFGHATLTVTSQPNS
jgi:hypothetical protein